MVLERGGGEGRDGVSIWYYSFVFFLPFLFFFSFMNVYGKSLDFLKLVLQRVTGMELEVDMDMEIGIRRE